MDGVPSSPTITHSKMSASPPQQSAHMCWRKKTPAKAPVSAMIRALARRLLRVPSQWNGVKYKACYGGSGKPSIMSEIESYLEKPLPKASTPAKIEETDFQTP